MTTYIEGDKVICQYTAPQWGNLTQYGFAVLEVPRVSSGVDYRVVKTMDPPDDLGLHVEAEERFTLKGQAIRRFQNLVTGRPNVTPMVPRAY